MQPSPPAEEEMRDFVYEQNQTPTSDAAIGQSKDMSWDPDENTQVRSITSTFHIKYVWKDLVPTHGETRQTLNHWPLFEPANLFNFKSI